MRKDEVEKRIEKLEDIKMVNIPDIVMWVPSGGGVFGHARLGKRTIPCSDEEEIEIMRSHYETDQHRVWGKGETVEFWVYLEAFSYLAPSELVERQKIVIDKLRRMNE